MFVPSSPGSELLNILEKKENEALARKEFSWGVKLVEKSGTPLNMLFIKKFPLLSGCPINTSPACGTEKLNCSVCENDALKCSPKNVVYLSECMDCKENVSEDCDRFLYVGESSRPLRMRTQEHSNSLTLFYAESNPTYFSRGGGIYSPLSFLEKRSFFV